MRRKGRNKTTGGKNMKKDRRKDDRRRKTEMLQNTGYVNYNG